MGFFDLKTRCAICDNEIGMNRNQLSKDVWICPNCLSKAGGILNFHIIKKMSIEEIRNTINEKNNMAIERENTITSNPLRTSDGMYQYCIENGYGQGMTKNWALKHFSLIENNLKDNEDVLMAFIGLHNYISSTQHDGNFGYVLTNKRFIIAQKKAIGEILQTISLDNINDITFSSSLLGGTVTIDTIKEKFNIYLNKDSAKKVFEKLHTFLDDIERISTTNNNKNTNVQSNISIADEVKKYKELLDIGAITQEEFDKTKAKLLNL